MSSFLQVTRRLLVSLVFSFLYGFAPRLLAASPTLSVSNLVLSSSLANTIMVTWDDSDATIDYYKIRYTRLLLSGVPYNVTNVTLPDFASNGMGKRSHTISGLSAGSMFRVTVWRCESDEETTESTTPTSPASPSATPADAMTWSGASTNESDTPATTIITSTGAPTTAASATTIASAT
eukprot:scpid101422/ scgid6695/ 